MHFGLQAKAGVFELSQFSGGALGRFVQRLAGRLLCLIKVRERLFVMTRGLGDGVGDRGFGGSAGGSDARRG